MAHPNREMSMSILKKTYIIKYRIICYFQRDLNTMSDKGLVLKFLDCLYDQAFQLDNLL